MHAEQRQHFSSQHEQRRRNGRRSPLMPIRLEELLPDAITVALTSFLGVSDAGRIAAEQS